MISTATDSKSLHKYMNIRITGLFIHLLRLLLSDIINTKQNNRPCIDENFRNAQKYIKKWPQAAGPAYIVLAASKN